MKRQRPLVFVVDDETDNLDLLVRSLPDYDVRSYSDPVAALKDAQELEPIGLVVDHKMPGMTGIELVESCSQHGVCGAVIMVTAFPELSEVKNAEANDLIYKVISKPYKPRYIQDILQLALIQRRQDGFVRNDNERS